MGADIHLVIEAKFNDKWVGLCEPGYTIPKLNKESYAIIDSRNYCLFHHLASVRSWPEWGPSLLGEPRGFPIDASDMSYWYLIDSEQDFGYHSASWATLEEFLMAYNMAEKQYALNRKEEYKSIDEYSILGHLWYRLRYYKRPVRIVFAFDN